jgi:hypothetical protein
LLASEDGIHFEEQENYLPLFDVAIWKGLALKIAG